MTEKRKDAQKNDLAYLLGAGKEINMVRAWGRLAYIRMRKIKAFLGSAKGDRQ